MAITTAVFVFYMLMAFAAASLSAFTVFLLFCDHPNAINAWGSGSVAAIFWTLLVRVGMDPNAAWNWLVEPIVDNPGVWISMVIVYSVVYVLLYHFVFFHDMDTPKIRSRAEDEKVTGGFPSEPE